MPPGYAQGQIRRELSEDPIEVDPKPPTKMADRIIVDPKKKTQLERQHFQEPPSKNAAPIPRPGSAMMSPSVATKQIHSPFRPRNNLHGNKSSPTNQREKRKAPATEARRPPKRSKDIAIIPSSPTRNGAHGHSIMVDDDDDMGVENSVGAGTLSPHFVNPKPTNNRKLLGLSSISSEIPDKSNNSTGNRWSKGSSSSLSNSKIGRGLLVSSKKRHPPETKMELVLFQQGCLVVERPTLVCTGSCVEDMKAHIFREGESDESSFQLWAYDVQTLKYNSEVKKIFIKNRNHVDNPKNGSFMQMIMKEAEDVEIMIQKLKGDRTRVSEISVQDIEAQSNSFREYAKDKPKERKEPTVIEHPARDELLATRCPAMGTIVVQPRAKKTKISEDMKGEQDTQPVPEQVTTRRHAPQRSTIAVVIPTTTNAPVRKSARTKKAPVDLDDEVEDSDIHDMDLEPDKPRRSAKPKRLRMPPKWTRPLVYPFEGQKRANVDFEDLDRLNPEEFLNDNLVNFYIRYLEEQLRERNPEVAKETHFFNTYFYERLSRKMEKGDDINKRIDGVLKWTRSIDVFEKKYVIVPINESSHWYLAIICNLQHLSRKLADDPTDSAGDADSDSTASPDHMETAEQVTADAGTHETTVANQESEEVTDGVEHMSIDETIVEAPREVPAADDWPIDGENQHRDEDLEQKNKAFQMPTEDSEDSSRLKAKAKSKSPPKPPRNSHPPDTPAIIILDSMGARRVGAVSNLKAWLKREAQTKRSLELGKDDIKGQFAKCPGQDNWYDCGLYVLHYIERFFLHSREFVTSILTKDTNVEDKNLWQQEDIADMRVRLFDLVVDLHTKYEHFEKEKQRAKKAALKDKKEQGHRDSSEPVCEHLPSGVQEMTAEQQLEQEMTTAAQPINDDMVMCDPPQQQTEDEDVEMTSPTTPHRSPTPELTCPEPPTPSNLATTWNVQPKFREPSLPGKATRAHSIEL